MGIDRLDRGLYTEWLQDAQHLLAIAASGSSDLPRCSVGAVVCARRRVIAAEPAVVVHMEFCDRSGRSAAVPEQELAFTGCTTRERVPMLVGLLAYRLRLRSTRPR